MFLSLTVLTAACWLSAFLTEQRKLLGGSALCRSNLCHGHSKCGLIGSIIGITQELVKNAKAWASPSPTCWIRNEDGAQEASKSVPAKCSWRFFWTLKFYKHWTTAYSLNPSDLVVSPSKSLLTSLYHCLGNDQNFAIHLFLFYTVSWMLFSTIMALRITYIITYIMLTLKSVFPCHNSHLSQNQQYFISIYHAAILH